LSRLRRALPLLTCAAAIAALYLYKLGGVGVLGPDEPRYAAIGRAMAQSGDYTTPRLWGSPWFEKPPLLYWMTAAGTLAGLGPEMAARLPVVLVSLAFLAAAYVSIRREFGFDVAAAFTVLLATSAGWIGFTDLALTDLPLAVFFSLAAFLALPLLRTPPSTTRLYWRFAAIGAAIGLGALAKGLVPIALAVPFLWFLRSYWRAWWVAFASFLLIALPWYVAAYMRNGYPFLEELFVKHHFERLYSASLQHVRPWYYYFPVLLAAVFPWTPLVGLLAARGFRWDMRRRFLGAICIFGFIVFSISLNKLPGYLLPLLPSLAVLIASGFETTAGRRSRLWLLPCALLIAIIPVVARALPEALVSGRFWPLPWGNATRAELFYVVAPLAVVLFARRSWAVPVLALCIVSGGIYMKSVAFPKLDREISARQYWTQIRDLPGTLCDGGMNRDWIFGLSFYRGSKLEPCRTGKFDFAIRSQGHAVPTVEPLTR
jgi:4-amino-4-deoxy-L-arabinose transferase-like glycosyltransferase